MNPWNLSGTSAQWGNNSATIAGDLAEPHKGFNVRIPDCVTQSAFNLFGISWVSDPVAAPASPKHISACGNTLRATYAESERFPVETQINWTTLDLDAVLLGLSVVVTIGTQELDAYPKIGLCSRITDALTLEPNGSGGTESERDSYTLCRPHDTDLTYVEMVHPGAPHSYRVSQDDGAGGTFLRHTLFDCPLEKGVILRARLLGLLLRRNGDEAAAAGCFARFCDVPPPLGR